MAALTLQAQTDAGHRAEYIRLMSEADDSIAAHSWQSADSLLRRAMSMEPGNPANAMIMSNLGMVRFYAGNDSAAVATLDLACSMAPGSVTLLNNRATVLASLGKAERALADWNAVIDIDSANVGARYLRSVEFVRQGRPLDALHDVEWLSANASSDPRSDLALATYRVASGDYAGALAPLGRCLERSPSAHLLGQRALCRLMTSDFDGASADLAEGIALDAADGELYLYRALLNRMRYRDADSRADARRAIELGVAPERAEPLLR